MNTDAMHNDAIPIDQISSEQHSHIDNQQDQNSAQNDTKPRKIVSDIKQTKTTPMNPTPLYASFFSFFQSSLKYLIREYSWWSTHPSETKVGIFVLFIIITIILSVMIVYFIKPKSGMIELLYIEIVSRFKQKFPKLHFNFPTKIFFMIE
jgi:hypothetical protein